MRRILLSLAFLGTAAVASAQQVGAGWSAFTGCWTPVSANGDRNMAANIPRVCVVPNGASSAELLTIVNDSITSRTPVDASGQRRDVSRQGCSGWEKAEFSADGRRLYLSGEQTCAGGLTRKTSGVFALTSSGDWVNAVDVSADSVSSVRVSRYASSSVTPTMPAEIRTALENREVSDRTARISAQREVGVDAIIEASKYLSPPVIEAWIAELDQDFNLDEKALVRLADAKVAPSVIDVMVAVSNPREFSVRSTGTVDRNEDSVRVRRDPYAPCFAPVIDPWAWYAYDPCDPYLRYSYYRPLYGRYGYPYGYYGRGYGYGGYYDPYYGSPVIIVSGGNRSHGRMTKDGYKSGGSSSSGSASGSSSGGRTATRSSGGESSSSGDKGSSGSSSAGSSGSGSSSSGGRTATRKPPTRTAEYQAADIRQPPIPRAPVEMTSRSSAPVSAPASASTTSGSSGSSSSSGSEGGRVATRKPPT
jgi:hypothetical protein